MATRIPKNIKLIVLACLAVAAWQGFSVAEKLQPQATKTLARKTSPGLHVLDIRPDRIVLEWLAPDLQVVRDPATGQVTEVRMGTLEPVHVPGVILLPRQTEIFDALPGKAAVTLLETEYETLSLGDCLPMPEDFILDERPSSASADPEWESEVQANRATMLERMQRTEKVAELSPNSHAEVLEAGVFRGHRLVALHLNPVQVNTSTGEGRVLKKAKIQVLRPNSSTNDLRLPDSQNEQASLRKMLGTMAETALPTRTPEAREAREASALDDDFPIYNVNRWRIYVRETSIVRVTGQYLQTVGVPIDQITPWDLHIWNRGHEIPIVVEGQEDGRFDEFDFIDFFAERNEKTYVERVPSLWQDPYSLENCYQLFWGDGQAGLRMGEEIGAWQPELNVELERSVRSKLHFERDRYFDRLSQLASVFGAQIWTKGPLGLVQDHWFWGERIDALTSRDFEVYLPFPNPNAPYSFEPVVVRACLTGYSSDYPAHNHYVTVSLNGLSDNGLTAGRQHSDDPAQAWTGQSPVIFETDQTDSVENILTADLVNGINIITVNVPGNEVAGARDKILVNWFEVEYERDMRARNGEFRFEFDKPVGDTAGYDVRGFPSPSIQVWRLGHSRLTNLETRRVAPADESASWAVRFPLVSEGPRDVLVFGENYILPPFLTVPDTFQVDLRNHPGAEYVMIVYDPLYPDTSVRILDSLRRISFDNSVLTIPLSEVYEQFSGGLITPHAIRDFLSYAYDHWSVRPTHCCLVGDAVLEQRENSIPGNQIPAFIVPTYDFGASSTDYLMGCVSGPVWDIIPDIAVGRISSRTPAELGTYVGKVLRYETDPDYQGLFQSNVLMVADYYDDYYEFSFASDYSEQTIRVMIDSAAVNVTRVYLDSIPSGQGPIFLRDALREGCIAANYNGHGGGGVWSGSQLINVGGVRLLNNRESFPFVTNFTCYVGAFDDRSQSSVLGEAFLFARNNNNDLVGAIGFYSSSGVGWAIAGQTMQRKLYDFMLREPYTLGEAALLNKSRWWTGASNFLGWNSTYSMMMMMNLLGDPGLKLKIPDEEFEPRLFAESNVLAPRDTTGNADSLRVIVNLPWAQDSSSVTFTYILPYNGDFRGISTFGFPMLVATHTPAFDENRITAEFCRAAVCTTDAVPLDGFVTPRGEVVVYAANPILKRSAIGRFPIYLADSLESVQIFDLEAVPGPVLFSEEPFRAQATILHEDDIQQVRFRGLYTPAQGPVVLDTMTMFEALPNVYQTTRDLGPYDFDGGTYRVKFYVTPVGDTEYESEYFTMPIETRPDLNLNSFVSGTPGERGGRRPYYSHPITVQRSGSSQRLDNMIVRLSATQDSSYIQDGDTIVVVLDSFTVDYHIPDDQYVEFERQLLIPTEFRPGEWKVKIVADPDSLIRESSEFNNTRTYELELPSYYPVLRGLGTYLPRPITLGPHKYWSLVNRDTLEVRVLPGALPRDSAAIGYTQPRLPSSAELVELAQRGMRPPFSQSVHGIFKAVLDDSLGALGNDFRGQVTLKLQGRDTLRSAVPTAPYAVYTRDPQLDQWVKTRGVSITRTPTDTTRVPSPPNPSQDTLVTWLLAVTGEFSTLGEIALFKTIDEDGPDVEISVGGLRFTQGAIVPATPQIFATFTDPAGVQRNDTAFFLILDGDTVAQSLITWNDTAWTANSLTAMFEPDLEPGAHLLRVVAEDNHGNRTSHDAEFEVRSGFGIEWAINYPNPFTRSTTIAYVLTGVTDEFTEAKIYTVSGRLIRTIRDTERATANYRTLQWDGQDEDGEEVANGVYFVKITAEQGDEKIEKTVKLAKVRK